MPGKNSFNMLRQLRLQIKTGFIRRELPEYEFMRRYPPLNRDTAAPYKKIEGRQLPYLNLYEKALSRNPLYLDERVYPAYWKEEPEAIVLARKQYNYMTTQGLDENSAYEKALKDVQVMESKSYEDFLSLMKLMKNKGVGSLLTQNQELNSKIEKYSKLLENTPYYSLKLADQGEIDYIIQVDLLKWGEVQRERRMKDPIFAARFEELRSIVFPKIQRDMIDLFQSKEHISEYKQRFKQFFNIDKSKNYFNYKEKFFIDDYINFYNRLVKKEFSQWKENERNELNNWILNTLAVKESLSESNNEEKSQYIEMLKKSYFPVLYSTSYKTLLTTDYMKKKLFENEISYKKDGYKLHAPRHYRIPAVLWPSEITKMRLNEIVQAADSAREGENKVKSKMAGEKKDIVELHDIFREASISETSRKDVILQMQKSNKTSAPTPVTDIKSLDTFARSNNSMTHEEQRLKSMQSMKKVAPVSASNTQVDKDIDESLTELSQFESEMIADPNSLLEMYDMIETSAAEPLKDEEEILSDKIFSAEERDKLKELVAELNEDGFDSEDVASNDSNDPEFLEVLEQYKPKTILETHRHKLLSVTEEFRLEDCSDLDELETFKRQRLDSSIVTRARLSTQYEQKESARRAREWRQRGMILEELPAPVLNIAKKNDI